MHVNGQIEHEGVVIDIVGRRVDVKIEAQSGCVGCAARSACGMSESQEKLVSVLCDDEYEAQSYAVGEIVSVSVERTMGIKAVVLAYVFPFLLLLTTLLVLLECGTGEVVAGLMSLVVVVLYYGGLYLLRDKIEREIIFKLRKI